MRYLGSFIVTLAWGLWFGGMIALFVFVQTLFAGNRAVAVDAAPMLFGAFERTQLLLAACALIGTFTLWLLTRRRAAMTLFALFAISAAVAALSTTLVTAPMEQLRMQGQTSDPQFKRLHGVSMMMYVSEAALLLAAGAILPSVMANAAPPPALDAPPQRETTPDTAAA